MSKALREFRPQACERSFPHAAHDWQGAASEWFRCPGKPSLLEALPPRPEVCGNCQADDTSIYWIATGGWSCRSCGASDYADAAE